MVPVDVCTSELVLLYHCLPRYLGRLVALRKLKCLEVEMESIKMSWKRAANIAGLNNFRAYYSLICSYWVLFSLFAVDLGHIGMFSNIAQFHDMWILDVWPFSWLCRYLFCCSYSHNVAPKGKFIAFVSTEAETDNPESELKPGIDLLGPVDEIFFETYDRFEPVNEPSLDNCFISTVSI